MSLDLHSLQQQYATVKEEGPKDFLDKFVKLPEGKGSVIMRLLPPAPAGMFGRQKNPFYQWTRIHNVNGKKIHDPREQINGKWVGDNPIADYLRWLWKESEKPQTSPIEKERLQALYRELKAIDRYYFNVIVRSETDDNGNTRKNVGPKIYSCGKTVFEAILRGICGDPEMNEAPLGDVTDFKTGRDFKLMKTIKRSGDRTYPTYEGSHFLEPSPLGTPDECEKWMAELHDLVSLRVLKSPAEIDHELQVHLGVKVDDAQTNFDPSKYQKAPTQVSVEQIVQPPKVEVKTAPAPVSQPAATTVVEEGGESLADDDFLNELRGLGGN